MTIEDTLDFRMEFGDNGMALVPVTIVELSTATVLYGASQNRQAFERTLATGKLTLWSKSRNKLWLKGETSGDYLRLAAPPRINCEQNQLLYLVELEGDAACHTGAVSCFYRELVVENGAVMGVRYVG